MWKIKDNVDLRKLEKFGYDKECDGTYVKNDKYCDERVEIYVEEDRTFLIEWGWYLMEGEEQERFLTDLIKANLVEEVSDK